MLGVLLIFIFLKQKKESAPRARTTVYLIFEDAVINFLLFRINWRNVLEMAGTALLSNAL